MSTRELVISDIEEAMKQIEDAYDLIEKGFTFLRENEIETGEETKKKYHAFDQRIGIAQSIITNQIYGGEAH